MRRYAADQKKTIGHAIVCCKGTCADNASPAGTNPDKPTWVAIKGTVFDVSKNPAYSEKGQYHGACAADHIVLSTRLPSELACWPFSANANVNTTVG